jgi:hypothetical protein
MRDLITDEHRDVIVHRVIDGLSTSGVPEYLRGGLVRYFSDGILPGGFLQAVLANDLRGTVSRADPYALLGLLSLVRFLVDHAPGVAWGSREAVLAWTTTPDRWEG